MNGTQIVCGLVMASLLGCGTEPEDGGPDPAVYTYVLSTMDNPAPAGRMVVGFNLDGLVSEAATAACSDRPDLVSFDGEMGIDNNLSIAGGSPGSWLVPTSLADVVEPRIAAGEFLLLMEVTGIDSTDNDASIGVRVYLGSAAVPIALEGGRIAEGQVFPQVGPDLANVAVGDARIVDRELTFELPTFPLGVGASASGQVLVLHDVHVRAHVEPQALSMGELGGALDGEEIAAYTGVSLDELRSGGLFDLDPSASDDTVCGAMSAGLSFEAVHSVAP
jgi:hypothetical protein